MPDLISKRTKPHYVYSIISVAMVLFLLGFLVGMMLYTRQIMGMLKEKIDFMVEVKENTDREEIKKLQTEIESSSFAKRGSVHFTSKEEGAKIMQKELGDDIPIADLPSMLYDAIFFNVNAASLDSDSLREIRKKIMQHESVNDVYFQEGLIGDISKNIEKIAWVTLIFGLLFIFVAFSLIHNTIRLALYSNRFLIKNMELVGASWEFISGPYIRRSFWNGLLSALLAILLLCTLLFLGKREFPELERLFYSPGFLLLTISIIIAGILITTLSTWYVVNKYLKMRLDELY